MKQANITNGPQQVNNGAAAVTDPEQHAQARPRAMAKEFEQNKLLEESHRQLREWMDNRPAQTAKRGH